VDAWREGNLHLVLSEFLLDEVAAVLAGSKFQLLLGWPMEQIARFVLELRDRYPIETPAEFARRL